MNSSRLLDFSIKHLSRYLIHKTAWRGLSTTNTNYTKELFEELKTTPKMIDTRDPKLEPDGHVYAKRPFKFECKANKVYMWCSCGFSRTQPFCDGTHRDAKMKIKNKPVRFECHEDKIYWFCNCKHTKNKPLCDGTHNTDAVQDARSTINQKY